MRIYALAKELKIDSKDLVDICTKAGITGKGSALASLTDDEVVRVKAFLKGPKPVEKPAAEVVPSDEPAPPAAEPEAPQRDEFTERKGPGHIKVIVGKTKAGEKKKEGDGGERKAARKREPIINVAPLPDVKQPTPPVVTEPQAQKPDLRLPKEALAGHKAGGRPPLEQLIKSEKAGRPEKPKKAPLDASFVDATGTDKARKGSERKSRVATRGELDRGLAGLASARADRQKRRAHAARGDSDTASRDDESSRSSARPRSLVHRGTNTAAPRKGRVALELPCTVRSFSEATGVSVAQVQKALMGLGNLLAVNARIDDELVELLAAEIGVELEVKRPQTLENTFLAQLASEADDPALLEPRPPVVTFLGHVDHGKTSLLDYLIGTNVVAGEAGGITQHIRAYQIEKDGRRIAFVDTPGHEAFTEMRARGANVTDIAVLVVAADDGVMPQTEEAISHIKAANVPILVALNKIDLPGVDPNRVMTQLTEYGLVPSAWGGDVEVVQTSATVGTGMEMLLDTILTIADLHEYRANPQRPAMGTCLEAEQQGQRGIIAKLMVKNGTLHVGDVVVCGGAHGRVKAMYDTIRPQVTHREAGPSMPVNVTGFDLAPGAGEPFYVLPDIGVAREIAEQRSARNRAASLAGLTTKVSFDEFQRRLAAGRLGKPDELVTLNLILRADVRGSIEAILKELGKLAHPEVQIKILQASVGGVTVADVTLAHASEAVIIGFNVIPDEAARSKADDLNVEIRRYDIIYKVADDIKALLEGRLKPEERVIELGQAVVKQVFAISRVGSVAGCFVLRGTIERGCRMRVNRDGRTIGDYAIDSLRRVREDVREVPRGMECGIKLAGFNDVKKDDILEAYKIEEVARTL